MVGVGSCRILKNGMGGALFWEVGAIELNTQQSFHSVAFKKVEKQAFISITVHSHCLTSRPTQYDADKIDTESKGNLHGLVSLSTMNTCTQFYTNHFLSVSVSISVLASANTP